MKSDPVIDTKKNESVPPEGFIKLYPYGKVGILFDGPEAYRNVAAECFRQAIKVRITVDDVTFGRAMRDRGTPDDAINQFLNSCLMFDEVHLG